VAVWAGRSPRQKLEINALPAYKIYPTERSEGVGGAPGAAQPDTGSRCYAAGPIKKNRFKI